MFSENPLTVLINIANKNLIKSSLKKPMTLLINIVIKI